MKSTKSADVDLAPLESRIKKEAAKRRIKPRTLVLKILNEALKPAPKLEEIAYFSTGDGDADGCLLQDRCGKLFLQRDDSDPKPVSEIEALKEFIAGACSEKWGKIIWRMVKEGSKS